MEATSPTRKLLVAAMWLTAIIALLVSLTSAQPHGAPSGGAIVAIAAIRASTAAGALLGAIIATAVKKPIGLALGLLLTVLGLLPLLAL